MKKQHVTIDAPEVFSLELSLDCGQAFRWSRDSEGYMCGVIGNRAYRLRQDGNKLTADCSQAEFDRVLRPYLDLDRDYKALVDAFSKDKNLKAAVSEFNGIRILRQQPWEALCSFIISQNNNIPRIKGIVSRLCESFGEKIGNGLYTFPCAEKLSELSPEQLSCIRAGFRDKYIIDAARKVTLGDVDFDKIDKNPVDFGRLELMKIKGVGKKVAECTLLYGFGKYEAFPRDVWVNRIMDEMYPDGMPECTCGYEGIAQQYLFHWRRYSPVFKDKE